MQMQWSLRQLLLGTFIVALIIPYIAAWVTSTQWEPLIPFSVTQADLQNWLQEIEPQIRVNGGGGTSSSPESVVADHDYEIKLSGVKSGEVMSHLATRLKGRFKAEGWNVLESGAANESFLFVISKDNSLYRIYVWDVPVMANGQNPPDSSSLNVMGIKVLKIGYAVPPR